MSEPTTLDRAALVQVFTALGRRLERRGVVADIYVIGGAAMAMAYDSRRATRDVDAVFVPHGIVLEEARAVAGDFSLPLWWLNEQASAYVAPGGDPDAPRVFENGGLRITAASPEHLLAMKMLAARRTDRRDIEYLIDRLDLTTAQQVVDICTRVFPDEEIPARARLLIEDLLAARPARPS